MLLPERQYPALLILSLLSLLNTFLSLLYAHLLLCSNHINFLTLIKRTRKQPACSNKPCMFINNNLCYYKSNRPFRITVDKGLSNITIMITMPDSRNAVSFRDNRVGMVPSNNIKNNIMKGSLLCKFFMTLFSIGIRSE